MSFSFILIGLVIYNTREAPTAGKEHSPFTVIYWKSYCNSLLCEWRCICRKSDPNSTPLLSVNAHGDINNYNTMEGDELETPPPKDALPRQLLSSIIDSENQRISKSDT